MGVIWGWRGRWDDHMVASWTCEALVALACGQSCQEQKVPANLRL